ncbi:hypothetical protein M8J76_009120 [Diaphorina citri]|nr:hypothetical protein M8J76_009120 [Diaphorina citri]
MTYLILKILLICLVAHNPTDSLSTSQLNSKKLLNKEKCTKIYPKKFVGYVPFGNRAAGNFTKVVPEEGLPMMVEQCVQTCCNDESCNIVFMYRAEGKIDCFLVQCDSNEKCRPVYRDDELRVQVSMVLVRPVTPESSWIAVLPDNVESPAYDSLTTPDHPMSHDLLTHCTLDTGCPENQYCDPTHFTCECKPGFEREQDISTTFGRLPFGRGFDSTNPRAEDVYGEESANGRLEGRVFGREPANGREGGVYRRAADSANERVERNDWAREVLPNERIERLVFAREGEESTNHRIEKRVFGNEGKASANHRRERRAFGNEGKEPANHRIERRVFESEREGLANQEAVYGRRKRGEGMCLPVMDESRLISSYVRAQTLSNDPSLLSPIYSEGGINPHQSLDHLNPSMSLGPDESKELNDPYQYQWTLLSSPEGGAETSMMDQNKATLRLRKLIRGVYVFRVNVTAKHASGHATGNVTVLPADRINQLPKAIINPSTLTVKLPNTVAVLDGTPSTDDDHIISYRWELQQGPLEYKPPALMNVSLLKLDNLNITGNYTFKLSVEDSNHEFNSTTANITVTKVPDYPPEANAGSDVILYLPNSNVTLNGNMSTDDHGLVSYEWTLRESLNQHKPVDMQKSKTPYLQLSNLELGTYTFTLKVTDGSNQSSTSDVHVFVKVASHQPPHAQAGGNYTVILPTTWVMLDATRSRAESDGVELVNFTWVQRAGPSRLVFVSLEPNEDVSLNSSSNMKINATNLTKGIYRVELIVRDINGNSASDVATIQVLQNGNQAPKANAGDNMILYSPQNYIILIPGDNMILYSPQNYIILIPGDNMILYSPQNYIILIPGDNMILYSPQNYIILIPGDNMILYSPQNYIILIPGDNMILYSPQNYIILIPGDNMILYSPQNYIILIPGDNMILYSPQNYIILIPGDNMILYSPQNYIILIPGDNMILYSPQNYIILIPGDNMILYSPQNYIILIPGDNMILYSPQNYIILIPGDNMILYSPQNYIILIPGDNMILYSPQNYIILIPGDNMILYSPQNYIILIPGDNMILYSPQNYIILIPGDNMILYSPQNYIILIPGDNMILYSPQNYIILIPGDNMILYSPQNYIILIPGDNMILYSPQNYIILNGSKSSDDLRIVRYVWTRDPTSNAMGDIIMNSDTQPVLILTNIVIGRYMFKLTVYDDQGLHSDDTVSINVKPDPLTFALTTLTLNIQASLISQSQASSLLLKLNLLLNPEHRVVPRQWSMDPDSKLATLTFLVNTTRGEVPASGLVQTARGEVEVGGAKVNGATRLVQPVRGGGARNGGTGLVRSSDVVGMIRDKLRLNRAVLDLDIVALKTFVCQNPCSGHGKCIEDTRICLCDSFWMRNLYARALTYDPLLYDDNCAWSILYVILALMLALTALLGVCACVCFRAHGGRKVYRSGRSAYKYKTMDKGYKEYKGKGNREEGIRLSTFPGTSSGEEESGGSSLEEFDIRNVARPNGVAKKMSMKT